MGYLLAVVMILAAVIGGVSLDQYTEATRTERAAQAGVIVDNMQVYRNAVVLYAAAHPGTTASVPDASLGLPTWYRRIQGIQNYVTGGAGYVYYASTSDGQARALLDRSSGDILVGVRQGGVLYNPRVGATGIALPSTIPEGAVVFAPSAASVASAPVPPATPPMPPAPPSDCAITAGTSRTWVATANSCAGTVGAATTVVNGATQTFTDPTPGNTGSATYTCTAGTLSTTANAGATCTAPPPPADCSVVAGTSRSWSVAGVSCAQTTASTTTVISGNTLRFTDPSPGNVGVADYTCTNGSLAGSPIAGATCAAPAATDCTVAGSTPRSWTVSGLACAGASPSSTTTLTNGASMTIASTNGNTGSASFACASGTFSSTANAGATCAAPVPPPPSGCTVLGSTSRSWSVGGVACTGSSPSSTTTLANGASMTIGSTNGNIGSGSFVCSSGTLSSTASSGATCATPCVVPNPSTNTNTKTQTVTQSIQCAAGQYGTNTQEQTQQSTQTQTASCPAPTGSPVWSAWSAWSAWTAVTGWTTVSNTCTACPATATNTATQWVPTSNGVCPAGQTGTITQEKEQTRTTTTSYSCPAGTTTLPAPAITSSGWADTGAVREVSNTCAAPTGVWVITSTGSAQVWGVSGTPPDASDFPACYWDMNCPSSSPYYVAPLPSPCTLGSTTTRATSRHADELFDNNGFCSQSNDCRWVVIEEFNTYACK